MEKAAKILGTMAIREVLKMGDPRLLAVAQPVLEFGTPELESLLADMRDTMRDLNGAGLAAPQIGVGLRVVIFGFEAQSALPGRGSGALHGAHQPRAHAPGRGPGRGLGGMPVGSRHARAGAAISRICAIPALTPPERPSTARSATFTPASCSTKSTISTAFCIRAAFAT